MPYDINGRPIDEEDDSAILKVVITVIAVFLSIALICFHLTAEPADDPVPVMQHTLALDYNNAAIMHAYGMPTAEDVMYYHMHGQWGYYEDGIQMTFDDLPGRNDRWDMLYGIEENPAFDK